MTETLSEKRARAVRTRWGAPDPVGRFWAKVDSTGDCWLWTAAVDDFGYGQIALARPGQKKAPTRAHRFSWEIANGQIPEGACVLHMCDNPRCVRPSHLFIGDRADNLRDMRTKGRGARGAMLPHSRLTGRAEEIVRRLSAGERAVSLAIEFGVGPSAIYLARSRYLHPDREAGDQVIAAVTRPRGRKNSGAIMARRAKKAPRETT